MRLGLQINHFTWPGHPGTIRQKLADTARAAEDAGFYSIWVMDHYFQIEDIGPAEDPMLEAYSTLSYIAALTEKPKLGAMVAGVTYRKPAFLIKQASTLDVLSGGRTYFGIGAAWQERESKGLGFEWPSRPERFERLEETLQIAHQMWSDNNGPYQGQHYQLAETINSPQPLSQPHPPILVGGAGEKKTLRLVAQYADACNIWFGEMGAGMQHKLDVLKQHCDAVGRDYADIEKTGICTFDLVSGKDTVKGVIELCRILGKMGVTQLIFESPDTDKSYSLDLFKREIIPAISDL
jgi:F420-dependent oxidoreductase-like protein